MTLNSSDRLTAIEAVKRGGVTDDQRRIIEELTLSNEILLDAPVVEANDRTVNTAVVRTALPKGQRRIYNQGVGTSASQTKVIHDVVAQLAIYSEVDASLVRNHADPQGFLMSEQVAFIDGLAQEQATDLFYGNHSLDPACIDGLAVRRDKLNGDNCFSAGGKTAGKQTSIYLVKWGQQFAKCIYPRGASGLGVSMEDKGIQTVEAPNGGKMEAYRIYYQIDYGLAVGHKQSVIRICNVDITSASLSGEELIKLILKYKSFLPQGDGTVSVLCNRDVMSLFDLATVDKANVVYTSKDPWGRDLNMIRDMRIRRCDSILNTESVVA